MIGDSFPPPAGGGTREVVVQVQGDGSSSVRPSPASFPPPSGWGRLWRGRRPGPSWLPEQLPSGSGIVPASGWGRYTRSRRPGPRWRPWRLPQQLSECSVVPASAGPRGGGTRGVVVRVRDDVRGGFCLSVAAFPPSVEGGTLGGVGDRAQATTRVGPAPWLFLATPGIGTCVAECFAANPVHSVKLLQGLPG